jgi:hypothetical protein
MVWLLSLQHAKWLNRNVCTVSQSRTTPCCTHACKPFLQRQLPTSQYLRYSYFTYLLGQSSRLAPQAGAAHQLHTSPQPPAGCGAVHALCSASMAAAALLLAAASLTGLMLLQQMLLLMLSWHVCMSCLHLLRTHSAACHGCQLAGSLLVQVE